MEESKWNNLQSVNSKRQSVNWNCHIMKIETILQMIKPDREIIFSEVTNGTLFHLKYLYYAYLQ
jgi:hypothetical protein